MKGKVYFIGAGPGDPELITVRGARIIGQADVIIYTGSLVSAEVVRDRREECRLYDSSSMALPEITALMRDAAAGGKTVARVHTGDPSIYGALREQLHALEKEGVEYEIVPGVSSFVAAAAALKKEYTLPGVSQAVILARREGRTPVPAGQDLGALAVHGASMAIFLSVHMIEETVRELLRGYSGDTPAAVVQRASWPDEKIVTGTLGDIAAKVKEEDIDKTALILVGDFLGDNFTPSRLYDPGFTHGYREGNR